MYNAAWAHINTQTSIWVNVKNGLSTCTLCNNPSSLYSYDDLMNYYQFCMHLYNSKEMQ